MTLDQVNGYAEALARLEKGRLKEAALAVRAGMASEKGWKAWLKELGK